MAGGIAHRTTSPGLQACDSIWIFADPLQQHTGIAYRDLAGERIWLHLAFHHKIARSRYTRNPDETIIVAVDLPKERATFVAELCDAIWDEFKQSKKMNYALGWHGGAFDSQGVYRPEGDDFGLTCSTFVLSIFQGSRLPLIMHETWEPREDDVPRQHELVKLLRDQGADAAHVAQVANEIPCVRFRPEEVAVAGLEVLDRRPTEFAQTAERGTDLVASPWRRGSPRGPPKPPAAPVAEPVPTQ